MSDKLVYLNKNIVCPFCGESGFDQMGFKAHLEGISPWTDDPYCKPYHLLTWDNQAEQFPEKVVRP